MEHKHEKAVITKKTEESRDDKYLSILGKVIAILKELETDSASDTEWLKKGVLSSVSNLYSHVKEDQDEKVLEVLGKILKLMRELENDNDYETSHRIRNVISSVWTLYL